MNPVELMATLNTVEQDHQMVLVKMQALKETVSCLLDPGPADLRRALARLRALNDYFGTQFTTHMDEEETTLFPFLAPQRPGATELVERLRREHKEIRRKLVEFANCLQVATEVGDGITRMVLWDLMGYGWELWQLLDRHAHDETQAVHECIGGWAAGQRQPAAGGRA